MFRNSSIFAAIASIAAALPATADSIRVGSRTYTEVFVRETSAAYYIHDPKTGEMHTAQKYRVNPANVHLSKPEARQALYDLWLLKRAGGLPDTPSAPTEPEKPTEPQIVPPPVSAPQLTNVPDKLAERRQGRKLYMDGEGVGVMTNQPGKFRGDREYVEVVIHYDPIVVPKKFRGSAPQPLPKAPENLPEIVNFYADFHDLDPELVYAIIRVESNGDPYAVSHAGARGLMQLMPMTASDMGVQNVFDPAENVAGGTQYIAKMLEYFDDDVTLALAAYNAGPGRVKQYGGVPPFKETKNYIRLVNRYRQQYARFGPPQFSAAVSRAVTADYLPPESARYYRIKLFNGLTLPAEGIEDRGEEYVYEFEGRSGTIPKDRVRIVYEPVAAD